MRILLFLFIFSLYQAQQKDCRIEPSIAYRNINVIDVGKMKCLAQQSENKTLFFTFGIWCEPCRLHIDDALKFAKEYHLNFYIILLDVNKPNNKYIEKAVSFLQNKEENIKILIVDDKYGNKIKRRNQNFVTEISLPNFENINDFSKYILINTKGEIEMVTNYKDKENDDWQDDSGIIKRKLLPLMNK